jgi:hypothetical protein|tara:strand:+ start:44 stop:1033 length:990 start_codon:yes stop_codon:yes gene_type:complete
MGLTQVSTDGVKNDAITKTKIPANQIEASELADNAVDTAAIADGAISESKLGSQIVTNGKIANNAVTNTRIQDNAITTAKIQDNNITTAKLASGATDLVNDSSPQLGGDLQSNSNNILLADNDVLVCGSGTDLKIFHDGTNNIISSEGSGQRLTLQSNGSVHATGTVVRIKDENNSETMAQFTADGTAELYYDNNKKFQTTSEGIQITESFKMAESGHGVNLIMVHENGVGNTASTTAQGPSCVGGGTVTVTVMHNGNTSITTTKMFPIMFQGDTTTNLGSEIFSINANSAASFAVNAATRGVTVTNNAGAHAKVRVTFNITANFAVDT